MGKNRISAAVLAVVIVLLVISASAAQMHGRGGMQRMGPQQAMGVGHGLRHGAGMLGGPGFMYQNGYAYGEYVTFSVNETSGIVYDYGISGKPLLTSIEVVDFEYGSTVVRGALTQIINTNDTIAIMLHDTPSAPLNYLATVDVTVLFEVADNVTISEDDPGVKLESDEFSAYIIAPAVTISGQLVTVDAPANSIVILRAAPVIFGYDGAVQSMNRNVVRRGVNDRIGAEISIGARGAYCIFDYANLTPLSYNNRTIVTIQNRTQTRLELAMNSDASAGRLLGINLDNAFELQERQTLRIRYDGSVMPCVADPELVLQARENTCWLNQYNNTRAQLMLYVSNFSEHILEIEVYEEVEPTATPVVTQIPTATPSEPTATAPATPDTPGFGALAGVTGVVVALIVKRRYGRSK
jgi:hypothetical protein